MEERYGNGPHKDSFLQFNATYYDEKGKQRVMGFAMTETLKLLNYKDLEMHVDATFIAPPGFYQVLIISVFDHGTKMFVPVLWILMTRKSERAYDIAFMNVVALVGELKNNKCICLRMRFLY